MAILTQFKPNKRVYLDTNCFIYFLENHPILEKPVQDIFQAVLNNNGKIVTSEFTIAEVLVKPYRLAQTELINLYLKLLNNQESIDLVKINQPVLKVASQIKANYKTPLADAIHIASAETIVQCDIFVTNDEKMRGLEHLKNCQVVFLASLLSQFIISNSKNLRFKHAYLIIPPATL